MRCISIVLRCYRRVCSQLDTLSTTTRRGRTHRANCISNQRAVITHGSQVESVDTLDLEVIANGPNTIDSSQD